MTSGTRVPPDGSRFRILDFTFAVDVESAEQARLVARMFEKTHEHGPPGSVFALAGHRSSVSLSCDGQLLHPALEPQDALSYLRSEVLRATRAGSPGAVLLHAAAVAQGRDVLLLPGRSGAGKSYLTLHLGLVGWSVLSDELVAIDIATAHVSGAAMPLNLKPSAGPAGDRLQRIGDATPTAAGRAGQDRNVRWIVAPSYRSDARLDLRAISPRDALLVLLSVMVAQRPAGLARLGSIVASAPAWVLTASNAEDAVNSIRDVCGQRMASR